ncbi:hypothetical protein ABZ642_27405 [Streptomyces sp. NPDC007157]|uniref:hypothetical protein n=1 Tax=Streptomyces sp. NPDC007157 TaxID=3154681 RepID=UPI0033CB502A
MIFAWRVRVRCGRRTGTALRVVAGTAVRAVPVTALTVVAAVPELSWMPRRLPVASSEWDQPAG